MLLVFCRRQITRVKFHVDELPINLIRKIDAGGKFNQIN